MATLRLLVALLLLASTATYSSAQPSCFGTPRVFPTAYGPGTLDTGDINGDGKPDFVVGYTGGCERGPGLTAYVGRGDGTFTPMVISSSQASPYGITLADLNHDGLADVIAAYGGCGGTLPRLDVLLSNGDGTFQAPVSYQAGQEPTRPETGDFNNDGNLDVIVNDVLSGGQKLLFGNGDGTLQPAVQTGAASSLDISVADFNNDGNLDFVYSQVFPDIVVQLGNGDGTFNGGFVFLTQTIAEPIAGDVNRDGNADIVLVSGSPEVMTVLLGAGNGTFRRKASYPILDEGSPVIADMGTDGIPDVVLADPKAPPDFKLFKGRGDGTFPKQTMVPSGTGTVSLKVADFNGDGLLDVVSVNQKVSLGTLLLNTGECH